MMEKTCETCRYWETWQKDKNYKEGYCHRRAPVATYADTEIHAIKKAIALLLWWSVSAKGGDPDKELDRFNLDPENGFHCTIWPSTNEDDWCGEWEMIEKKEKKKEAA